MKSNGKMGLFYIVLILGIIILASVFVTENTKEITYSDVVGHFNDKEVDSFIIESDGTLTLTLKDNKGKVKHTLLSLTIFYEDLKDTIHEQKAEGILTGYDYKSPQKLPWWISIWPYILVIGIMVILWWMFIKNTSGAGNKNSSNGSGGGGFGGLGGRMNSFSKARTKLGSDEKNKVTFKDVAGFEEEKEEMQEVVSFLKDPAKYSILGARIPKGVLMVGAPGTGKTYLAKAVAGEAGVPFYSISGSDFVEMYVGVGASRVRDLFETAKKTAPCIIFIDEIDAVGRHRGAGLGGGHDEREQTLNQLLVEMDGFGINDSVIIMAATNRPDILDPALLRPGRFDRQITINYPDIKGRTEILKIHARNKPLEENVDLETVAKTTSGFTPADLANLLNEAALLAARKNKKLIGMREIEEANIKVIVGPQKRSMVIREEDKKNTAYHEAGHAIIGFMLPSLPPVHQVSVIPSGRALGYTLSLPENDKYSVYRNELIEEIAELLGGRVAEKIILNDFSGGASNDIKRATEIARKMVTQYGMSDKLGPILFGTGNDEVFLGRDYSNSRNYSEKIAAEIDEEIQAIINQGYQIAEKILTENIDKLHFIAEYLFKNEIMDREQFELVFTENPTFEMLDEVRERKKSKSRAENEQKQTEETESVKTEEAEKTEAVDKEQKETNGSEPPEQE